MPLDYKGRIGNLIRDARQHRGLTQQQLAELLSTSQSAINRIEKGHQNLSLEMLARIGEALDSELVRERGMVAEVEQPGAQQPVRLVGHPVKFSGTPADPHRPGPALGQHTAEVLTSLGYSDEQVAELQRSGAALGPSEGTQGSFMA